MAGIGCYCLRGGSGTPLTLSSSSSTSRGFVLPAFGRVFASLAAVRIQRRSRDSNSSSTPQFLKFAVSGVTELLRLLSPAASAPRLDTVGDDEKNEILVSGVDDVLDIIKSDYEKAYFLTGIFTSEIYADDCLFEDPTIKFRGTELYARNLQLLVPFFDQPSIVLRQIEKGINSKSNFVLAKWQLRTYLKLPWKPLISIDGNTVYDLDDQFKIVRHAESWNVSALEAVAQIFRSNGRRSD